MGREHDCSRPFYFPCGYDLTAECLPATEVLADGHLPGAIPGSRTNLLRNAHSILTASAFRTFAAKTSRAPARAAESPKLSLPGAAPGRLANLSWGSWQTSNAPALQAG